MMTKESLGFIIVLAGRRQHRPQAHLNSTIRFNSPSNLWPLFWGSLM